MVWCCLCAHSAWGYNERVGSFGAVAPCAQMTTTSSSLISMQAHERIAGACHTSFSNCYTPTEQTSPSDSHGQIRKVGPNKPNEPGVPIGNGSLLLVLLVFFYGMYKKTGKTDAKTYFFNKKVDKKLRI